jgi:hypothetical protein
MNPLITDKTCFIITGQLHDSTTVHNLIQSFENIEHKIISTWETENPVLLETLMDHGFKVLYNEVPDHIKLETNTQHKNQELSANIQSYQILQGCKLAIQLGFEYCVRTRTDLVSNNYSLILETIFPLLSENKLVCLSGISFDTLSPQSGKSLAKTHFYLDYFLFGKLTHFIKYFDRILTKIHNNGGPERGWIESYLGKTTISREDILSLFTFCGEELQSTSAVLMWYGRCDYELIHLYCNPKFNQNIWYTVDTI